MHALGLSFVAASEEDDESTSSVNAPELSFSFTSEKSRSIISYIWDCRWYTLLDTISFIFLSVLSFSFSTLGDDIF